MYEILPGILEQEWETIEKKLEIVRPFAKSIHIDLLDGKFAPNTTLLDPTPFAKYSNDFFFELHMMVEEPINYLDAWAKAGFKRFLGHVEKMSDQVAFVAKAEQLGEVGLVLDGKTTVDALQVPLIDLDCVLVMAINAGFSGQQFMAEHMEKVYTLREKSSTLSIEVDGGINDKTIIEAKKQGATRFISTSFLFNQGNSPQEQYQVLQQLLND